MTEGRVIASRTVAGICWQAVIGADRQRLAVVAVVPPSSEPTIVELLSDAELRQLLSAGHDEERDVWICSECQARNARGRGWCWQCSTQR